MDRVAALVALERRVLEAFSRRTIDTLRAALPLRIALAHLEPFLAANVAKEARKDALVIRRAGEALVAGKPPGADAVPPLLDSAREIDRDFFRRVGKFPVRMAVPYERIEPLRQRRIERVLELAYRILGRWRAGGRLRDEVARGELEQRLLEILELYIRETLALSHSVRLPALLAPLRARLARSLDDVMHEVAKRLAGEIASGTHRSGRN